MSTRKEPIPSAELTARIAVRVPDGDDGSLVESARQRLAQPAAVDRVNIVALDSIDPRLSATVVELEVDVTLTAPADPTTTLETAPGAERVDARTH